MVREAPPYFVVASVLLAFAVVFIVAGAETQNAAGAAHNAGTLASNDQQQAAPAQEPIALEFTAQHYYDFVELSWDSDADGCTATGRWSGEKPASGVDQVFPYEASTYELTCTRGTQSVSENVHVEPVEEDYYEDDFYYEDAFY